MKLPIGLSGIQVLENLQERPQKNGDFLFNGVGGFRLVRKTWHRISRVMGHTGVVFHFEREFREAKTPTGQPTLRIGEVHDPSEGMEIRSYDDFSSLQIDL
jgi:hypothetical protein